MINWSKDSWDYVINKITVKDAWVNSVATGLPPAQCRDAGMDFYLNSPQKNPALNSKKEFC